MPRRQDITKGYETDSGNNVILTQDDIESVFVILNLAASALRVASTASNVQTSTQIPAAR